MKKTNEQFIKEVKDLVGDEYTFLDEYIDNSTKIRVKHNICKRDFLVSPSNFLSTRKGRKSGTRCPYCYGNKKKTTDDFKKEVYELEGDNYLVLGEYKGTHEHIKMKHVLCGNEFDTTPNHFLNRGQRCPICGKNKSIENRTLTLEKFKEKVFQKFGNEYIIPKGEKYINNKTKIRIQHNIKECKNIFKARPDVFLNGNCHCKCCSDKKSKGQNELYEFIKSLYEN